MPAIRNVLVFLIAFFPLSAQEPSPMPPETPSAIGESGLLGRMGSGFSSQPQAYDKVITKDAKSKTGVFTVHEVKEKYYYEIPKTELNKEFLLSRRLRAPRWASATAASLFPSGWSAGSAMPTRSTSGEVNYEVVADPKTPISLAVKAANNDTIIMSFPIAAFGKEPGKEKDEEARTARER